MNPEYEQMELDTRPALLKAISTVTSDAIGTAREMMQRHNQEEAAQGHTVPDPLGQAGSGLQDPEEEESHQQVHRQAPQREVREADEI